MGKGERDVSKCTTNKQHDIKNKKSCYTITPIFILCGHFLIIFFLSAVSVNVKIKNTTKRQDYTVVQVGSLRNTYLRDYLTL